MIAPRYAELLPDASAEAPEDLALLDAWLDSLPRGAIVIDAGCGTGRLIPRLRHADATRLVVGVDSSPGMLTQARSLHPGVDFQLASLTSLPSADSSVDAILSWYSIIHTASADLLDVVREFRRVLAPSGSALLAFQAGSGERIIRDAYGSGRDLIAHLHDPADVAAQFALEGFTIRRAFERAPRHEKHPQGFVVVDA